MVIYKEKKILVTGANGFIGSNLLKFLNRKKFLVTGLSNSRSNNGSINSLSLLSRKKINQFFHEHDFDLVIHLGASLEELEPSCGETCFDAFGFDALVCCDLAACFGTFGTFRTKNVPRDLANVPSRRTSIEIFDIFPSSIKFAIFLGFCADRFVSPRAFE